MSTEDDTIIMLLPRVVFGVYPSRAVAEFIYGEKNLMALNLQTYEDYQFPNGFGILLEDRVHIVAKLCVSNRSNMFF